MISPQLIWTALVGLVQREQDETIQYLREENRVLKAQLHGRRLRLTDDNRRRLAVLGQRLGCRVLTQVATLITPDTILCWHRELIARKWTYPSRAHCSWRDRATHFATVRTLIPSYRTLRGENLEVQHRTRACQRTNCHEYRSADVSPIEGYSMPP